MKIKTPPSSKLNFDSNRLSTSFVSPFNIELENEDIKDTIDNDLEDDRDYECDSDLEDQDKSASMESDWMALQPAQRIAMAVLVDEIADLKAFLKPRRQGERVRGRTLSGKPLGEIRWFLENSDGGELLADTLGLEMFWLLRDRALKMLEKAEKVNPWAACKNFKYSLSGESCTFDNDDDDGEVWVVPTSSEPTRIGGTRSKGGYKVRGGVGSGSPITGDKRVKGAWDRLEDGQGITGRSVSPRGNSVSPIVNGKRGSTPSIEIDAPEAPSNDIVPPTNVLKWWGEKVSRWWATERATRPASSSKTGNWEFGEDIILGNACSLPLEQQIGKVGVSGVKLEQGELFEVPATGEKRTKRKSPRNVIVPPINLVVIQGELFGESELNGVSK